MRPRPLYYFAYGSNLHPLRVHERIGSTPPSTVAVLQSVRLRFNKLGTDGSSKCNIEWTTNPQDTVSGALWVITPEQKNVLDAIERGYRAMEVQVVCHDSAIDAMTYVARDTHVDEATLPYQWYVRLVIAGATYYEFDAEEIRRIAEHSACDDLDADREERHRRLIARISADMPGTFKETST